MDPWREGPGMSLDLEDQVKAFTAERMAFEEVMIHRVYCIHSRTLIHVAPSQL